MLLCLYAICLVDMFQSKVGKTTEESLEHLEWEIHFPETQICW